MTCYTALITPFDEKGELDEEGFQKNLSFQSVDGLVVLGTTGEAPTLTQNEKKQLISLARLSSLPLMVGCGAYSTKQTMENIKLAADLGADSALVVSPYYNKPTQDGLYHHFITLAQSSPLPIILYNHRGRTSVNLEPETVRKLIEHPKIVGIKETSHQLTQICDIIALKKERPDFLVYAGDDVLTFSMMTLGGDGVISVTSNLVPSLMMQLLEACKSGNNSLAQEKHFQLLPLFKATALETNPIPIKAAMQMAGYAAGNPRLPLTPLNPTHLPALEAVMRKIL